LSTAKVVVVAAGVIDWVNTGDNEAAKSLSPP